MFFETVDQIRNQANLINFSIEDYLNSVITAHYYNYEFFLPSKQEADKLFKIIPNTLYLGDTPYYPNIEIKQWAEKPQELWIVNVIHNIPVEDRIR